MASRGKLREIPLMMIKIEEEGGIIARKVFSSQFSTSSDKIDDLSQRFAKAGNIFILISVEWAMKDVSADNLILMLLFFSLSQLTYELMNITPIAMRINKNLNFRDLCGGHCEGNFSVPHISICVKMESEDRLIPCSICLKQRPKKASTKKNRLDWWYSQRCEFS